MDYRALASSFPTQLHFPESVEYTAFSKSYFAAFENELSPGCVFQPESAREVADFVKAFGSAQLSGGAQLAIKGGGHTAWAGSANIEGGVTIDLSKLRGVKLSEDDPGTVLVAGGEQWANVYSALEAQGLAAAGGRVSKVGVGGLTLGGGLSFFSATSGFVCDNVVSFEVVLASGEIVQASAESNQDLFVALKGGSNNFGIVTKLELRVFQQGQLWGGAIFYNSSAVPDLYRAFATFAGDPTPDEQAHLIVACSWTGGNEFGIANLYHTTPSDNPPSLAPFVNIQPQLYNTLRKDSLLKFTEEQSAFSTNGARQWYFTTCFQLDLSLMSEIRQLWHQTVQSITDVPGLVISLVFQPLTKGILTKSEQKGGNSLGLSPGDGPIVITLLNTVHQSPDDDDRVRNTVLDLIEKIDAVSANQGKSARYRFMNYGYKTQAILQGYGPDSVNQLRRTAKKYDPEGFFQDIVTTGFKLPEED